MGNDERKRKLMEDLSKPGAWEAYQALYFRKQHPLHHLSRGHHKEMLGMNSEYERNLERAFKEHDKETVELSTYPDLKKPQYYKISDDDLEHVKWDSVAFRQQYYNDPPPKERAPTHTSDAFEIAITKMIEAMPEHFKSEKHRIGFVGAPRFVAPWMHMAGIEIVAPPRPAIHVNLDFANFNKGMHELNVAAREASLMLGGISRIVMTPINSFTWRGSTSLVSKRSQRRQTRKAKQPPIRKYLRKL